MKWMNIYYVTRVHGYISKYIYHLPASYAAIDCQLIAFNLENRGNEIEMLKDVARSNFKCKNRQSNGSWTLVTITCGSGIEKNTIRRRNDE